MIFFNYRMKLLIKINNKYSRFIFYLYNEDNKNQRQQKTYFIFILEKYKLLKKKYIYIIKQSLPALIFDIKTESVIAGPSSRLIFNINVKM